MADIELNWIASSFGADMRLAGAMLSQDNELRTAVVVSLFSWARANDEDVLPDEDATRQGFWGDSYPVEQGHKVGSRLWLLRREKLTTQTIARAQEYCREALQWLLDDKIASNVEVVCVRNGIDRLDISVTITRYYGGKTKLDFNDAWRAINSGVTNG
jgi:phage gp46-like protein